MPHQDGRASRHDNVYIARQVISIFPSFLILTCFMTELPVGANGLPNP